MQRSPLVSLVLLIIGALALLFPPATKAHPGSAPQPNPLLATACSTTYLVNTGFDDGTAQGWTATSTSSQYVSGPKEPGSNGTAYAWGLYLSYPYDPPPLSGGRTTVERSVSLSAGQTYCVGVHLRGQPNGTGSAGSATLYMIAPGGGSTFLATDDGHLNEGEAYSGAFGQYDSEYTAATTGTYKLRVEMTADQANVASVESESVAPDDAYPAFDEIRLSPVSGSTPQTDPYECASSIPVIGSPVEAVSSSKSTGIAIPSPAPFATLDRISYDGDVPDKAPGDPQVAIGPHTVITVLNVHFTIYSKTSPGTRLYASLFRDWFGMPEPTYQLVDPRIIYDQFNNRFVMMLMARRENPREAYWLVAVSKDSTGRDWYNYVFNAQYDGATLRSNRSVDYPNMGTDGLALYLTINTFDPGVQGSNDVKLRIINLTPLYAGQNVTWVDCFNFREADGAVIDRLSPAHQFAEFSKGPAYFLNAKQNGGTFITLWKLTDPLSNSPSLTRRTIPVEAYAVPPEAQQPNTTKQIDTFSTRIEAHLRYGSVWASQTVKHSTGRAGIRWYQLDPEAGQVKQSGTFGNSISDSYYPALSTDRFGNVTIVFSQSSDTQFVSVRSISRLFTDPLNYITPVSTLIKAGEGTYEQGAPNEPSRWGDYGGNTLDPDGQHFWGFHSYAKSGNRIGNWIATRRFRKIYLPLVVR